MEFLLKNIKVHSNQGRRVYQEDSFAYGVNYILVSDGVGGLAKGDVASGIVKYVWQEALDHHKIHVEDLEGSVQSIVQETIHALNTYAADHTESMGMGATLAFAAIIDGKMISMHIGDSRIYHFSKDGEIKWRSTNHSLVQELVTGGIITEDEAATHPRRNVITRVLQAKEGHETKAAVHLLDNIVSGDIFMVCSDGINESWSDAGMSSVIMGHQEVNDIISIIGAHSAENSGDNNTALMAEIEIDETTQKIAESTSNTIQEINDVSGYNKQNAMPIDAKSDKPVSSKKPEETEADPILQQRSYGTKQKYYRLAIFAIMIILIIILLYQKYS